MTAAPYMPLYVGDYLADTTHLTTFEHGAYLLILMAMWRGGGTLKNDARLLMKCARVRADKWPAVSRVVLPFFVVEGSEITHKRLAIEMHKYLDRVRKASLAGEHSARSKSLKKRASVLTLVQPQNNQPEPEPRDRTLRPNDEESSISGDALLASALKSRSLTSPGLTAEQKTFLESKGVVL